MLRLAIKTRQEYFTSRMLEQTVHRGNLAQKIARSSSLIRNVSLAQGRGKFNIRILPRLLPFKVQCSKFKARPEIGEVVRSARTRQERLFQRPGRRRSQNALGHLGQSRLSF